MTPKDEPIPVSPMSAHRGERFGRALNAGSAWPTCLDCGLNHPTGIGAELHPDWVLDMASVYCSERKRIEEALKYPRWADLPDYEHKPHCMEGHVQKACSAGCNGEPREYPTTFEYAASQGRWSK